MKIAAIDIGSNAVRTIIGTLAPEESSHYLIQEQKRYPLRLGKESFLYREFRQYSFEQAALFMKKITQSMKDHSVSLCLCTGTSALRMATNRQELIHQTQRQFGISINTIEGNLEALLVSLAILHRSPQDSKNTPHLLIDLGGGSTEIILCQGKTILKATSVSVGTINLLQQDHQRESLLQKIKETINQSITPLIKKRGVVLVTGTGGSLRYFGKLKKILFDQKNTTTLLPEELLAVGKKIVESNVQERIKLWRASPNRAELVVPAHHILSTCLESFNWQQIHLPRIGLADGLLDLLAKEALRFQREETDSGIFPEQVVVDDQELVVSCGFS